MFEKIMVVYCILQFTKCCHLPDFTSSLWPSLEVDASPEEQREPWRCWVTQPKAPPAGQRPPGEGGSTSWMGKWESSGAGGGETSSWRRWVLLFLPPKRTGTWFLTWPSPGGLDGGCPALSGSLDPQVWGGGTARPSEGLPRGSGDRLLGSGRNRGPSCSAHTTARPMWQGVRKEDGINIYYIYCLLLKCYIFISIFKL